MFLMLVPAVVYIIAMAYLPMSGLVMAFKDFRYNKGIFGSDWNGFNNFAFFFRSGTAWNVTKNTILYNVRNLVSTQLLAILLALAITELGGKWFKRISQSFIFFPHFMSWIIVGIFAYNILNYETGALNTLRTALSMDKINVYAQPGLWPWIIMIVNAWKSIGFASVVYIAAITGVDAECYEAAEIDGANIFQRIWHITLPSIRPTIITIVLLNIGTILRGNYEMFYQLVGNNGQLFKATDVIDTYVFRALAGGTADMGLTAAATFYQSILCFVIIITVNGIVRKIDKDYALF